MKQDRSPNDFGRPVPLFGRWRNAYFAVVAIFVLEVGFFYFVSHYFS